MNIYLKPLLALAVIALAGCVSSLQPPAFSEQSPANPKAAESNVPSATPALMSGTNVPGAVSSPQPEMQEHNHQHHDHQ